MISCSFLSEQFPNLYESLFSVLIPIHGSPRVGVAYFVSMSDIGSTEIALLVCVCRVYAQRFWITLSIGWIVRMVYSTQRAKGRDQTCYSDLGQWNSPAVLSRRAAVYYIIVYHSMLVSATTLTAAADWDGQMVGNASLWRSVRYLSKYVRNSTLLAARRDYDTYGTSHWLRCWLLDNFTGFRVSCEMRWLGFDYDE